MNIKSTSRHVFLSYSHDDVAIMIRIRKELENKGIHVWTDEGLIPGTESWKREIENAIQQALGLIVILSPSAKESLWVERELDFAGVHGIRVFPILVHGEPSSAIPIELINAQWVDLRQEANFPTQIQKLVLALEGNTTQVSNFIERPKSETSSVRQKTVRSNPQIAIVITIILSICVVLTTTLIIIFGPGIIDDLRSNRKISEANPPPSSQGTIAATVPAVTPIPPTETQKSDSPVDDPTTTVSPTLLPTHTENPPTFTSEPQWGFADCINSSVWSVYPSSASITTDNKGCIIASNLGFYAQNQGLDISIQNPNSGQRYGLYAPIHSDVIIEFDIKIDQLATTIDNQLVSLGLGIISHNPVNTETDGFIYYVIESPNTGYPVFIKKGERGGYEQYIQLDGDYFRYPLGTSHRCSFAIDGDHLTIYIDGKFIRETDLAFENHAFFIGYKFENAGSLNARISDLSIQER